VGDGDCRKWFYKQMGLDSESDTKALSQYLPSGGVFATFIFDHFDRSMDLLLISLLSEDSLRSASYNLLVLVNDSLNAHALLLSCGQHLLQREATRLLGPPFCGKWSANELGDDFRDERYDALVDQSGTLAPMISVRNRTCLPSDPLMLLRVAKLERDWDDGERLLGCFREYIV
jgi:hypothetical protein